MKQNITLQLEKQVLAYAQGIAVDTTLTLSEVLRTLIQVGLEHRKESDAVLARRQRLVIEQQKHELGDEEIHYAMKRAHMRDNYIKLRKKLQFNPYVPEEEREAVLAFARQRIRDVLGDDHPITKAVMRGHDHDKGPPETNHS